MKNPINVAGNFVFNVWKETYSADHAREYACLGFNISTLYAIAYVAKKCLYPPFTPQGIAFVAVCLLAREIFHKAMFSGRVKGAVNQAFYFTPSPHINYPIFYISPGMRDGWAALKKICSESCSG